MNHKDTGIFFWVTMVTCWDNEIPAYIAHSISAKFLPNKDYVMLHEKRLMSFVTSETLTLIPSGFVTSETLTLIPPGFVTLTLIPTGFVTSETLTLIPPGFVTSDLDPCRLCDQWPWPWSPQALWPVTLTSIPTGFVTSESLTVNLHSLKRVYVVNLSVRDAFLMHQITVQVLFFFLVS